MSPACHGDVEAPVLDRLLPMHLRVSGTGEIVHVGPTLAKLRPPGGLVGRALLDVFVLRRPRGLARFADLQARAGARWLLRFAAPPETQFNGHAVAMAGGDGLILNLSFGISITESVSQYQLHSADFAPTDLTVEMLYLLEAKSALMEESRRLNTRLQAARVAAEEQAFTDTLTGLKNRRALGNVLARYAANGRPYALMHLDLDHFKAVNDSLGHAAGDHVLQQVARLMVQETRAGDTLVRSGGDEFLLILPDMTGPAQLRGLATRLIAAIERPIAFDGSFCRISASAGVSIETGGLALSPDAHIQRSDAALYRSKNRGRACVTLYDDPDPAACGQTRAAE
jgi:diguanylate cyclase (GGDEF)-like protein